MTTTGLIFRRDKRLDLMNHLRNITLNRLPNLGKIDSRILMSQDVSHTNHLCSGNIRPQLLQLRRDIAGSLANNFK